MRSTSKKLVIEMKVLPGEPTDGGGRICIHLVVVDEKRGPFVESCVVHPAKDADGKVIPSKFVFRPTRCRVACDPRKVPQTKPRNGVVMMLMRTNDSRAVTCPKCKESPEYKLMMKDIEERS